MKEKKAVKEAKKDEGRYSVVDMNGLENKPLADRLNQSIKGKIVASLGNFFVIDKEE